MKDADVTLAKHIATEEATTAVATEISKVLDAKNQKVDLRLDIVEAYNTLNTGEKEKLFHVLEKHEELFDSTSGTWKNFQYDIELQEGVKPYHGKPHTVPKAYEATLCMEVDCLCKIGVLRKVNQSEWGAPTFVIPKKDKMVRLKCAGLKVDAQKSFFGCQELDYLGYWVTRQGIKPLQKKVEAILKIAPPKTKKQLCSFISMINYYHVMWHRCNKVLALLVSLTSNRTPWKWMHIEQMAFEKAKKIIGQETLLVYPDFKKPFEIHMDARDTQLGAVISQQEMPVVFYSRKLNNAQKSYTTMD
eukprot:15366922-Ditylum_brightwellii.AAC.1